MAAALIYRVRQNPSNSYPDRNWRIEIKCQLPSPSPLRLFHWNSVLAALFSPYWSRLKLTSDRSIVYDLKKKQLIAIASLQCACCTECSQCFISKLVKTKPWYLCTLWAIRELVLSYCASVSKVCSSNGYPCPRSPTAGSRRWHSNSFTTLLFVCLMFTFIDLLISVQMKRHLLANIIVL